MSWTADRLLLVPVDMFNRPGSFSLWRCSEREVEHANQLQDGVDWACAVVREHCMPLSGGVACETNTYTQASLKGAALVGLQAA